MSCAQWKGCRALHSILINLHDIRTVGVGAAVLHLCILLVCIYHDSKPIKCVAQSHASVHIGARLGGRKSVMGSRGRHSSRSARRKKPTAKKALTSQKQTPQSNAAPKRVEQKKAVAQKTVASKTKVQPKKLKKEKASKLPVAKAIEKNLPKPDPVPAAEEPVAPELKKEPEIIEPAQSVQDPIVIDLDSENLEAADGESSEMTLGYVLSQALLTAWRPPRGVVLDQPAVVRIVLDSGGRPSSVVIVQSSKIRAFDASAQVAAHHAKYPRSVWGRVLEISFM